MGARNSEDVSSSAIDKLNAVVKLRCELEALEEDAAHEALNGTGIFSREYCQELAQRYRKGVQLCQDFIRGVICDECLVKKLIEQQLQDFAYDLVEEEEED